VPSANMRSYGLQEAAVCGSIRARCCERLREMIGHLGNESAGEGRIDVVNGNGDMPKVMLKHASGSQAEVYLHGGHVTKWSVPGHGDILFVSQASNFSPEKPIRGGIPVCFPQFGSKGPLPQHGFARISEWQLVDTQILADGGVSAHLRLTDSPQTRSLWPFSFVLGIQVLLNENTLSLTLNLQNTHDSVFEFQAALHTYFSLADISRASVQGLQGVTYLDSLQGDAAFTESAPVLRFSGETDRVYIDAPDIVELKDEESGRTVNIRKRNMPDIVVWNPWIAKSKRMTDFGDDEYLRMVCVETGIIAKPKKLGPGKHWEGDTILSC